MEEIKKHLTIYEEFDLSKFGSNIPKELQEKFSEMVLENSDPENTDLIVRELTKLDLKEQHEDLGRKIRESENDEELLKEFDKLSKKLSTL